MPSAANRLACSASSNSRRRSEVLPNSCRVNQSTCRWSWASRSVRSETAAVSWAFSC